MHAFQWYKFLPVHFKFYAWFAQQIHWLAIKNQRTSEDTSLIYCCIYPDLLNTHPCVCVYVYACMCTCFICRFKTYDHMYIACIYIWMSCVYLYISVYVTHTHIHTYNMYIACIYSSNYYYHCLVLDQVRILDACCALSLKKI